MTRRPSLDLMPISLPYVAEPTRYDTMANMATLMGAFQVIILNRTASEAWD